MSLSDFRKSLQRSAEREREIEKEATDVVTEEQAKAVEQVTGIKPKNLRDVFKAGREVFGLNRSQALAQAIIVDRVIGKIAKRRGVSKSRIYSTVEFKKSELDDITPQARNLYQAVWHVSPHAFEKFTTEKIGTGEGAQAFGWGLYFTDKENIARSYAKISRGTLVDKSGNEIVIKSPISPEGFAKIMLSSDNTYEGARKSINTHPDEVFKQKVLRVLDKWEADGVYIKSNRNLYKVKLHGDRAIDDFNYLRWDKKITRDELTKLFDNDIDGTVKEALFDWLSERYDVESNEDLISTIVDDLELLGGELYKGLTRSMTPKDASMALLNAKIDGIKYPTEITRKGTHEESFNYVIFDENVAEIEDHIKFQKGQGAKGAIQFMEDGNAIIHALTDPNVSTPLHEIAHLYEKYMTKSERDAVLRWAKTKEWNVDTSEKFARGFEKYLAEGVAPNEALKRVFDRFKAWLTDIYNGITGSEIDIELNDEMRGVYNAMLGEGTVRPKKTKKVEYKKEFKNVDDLLFQAPQTDAFKKWFKDSKAVDENGEPLILLHGSPLGGISEFKIDEETVQSSGLRELGTFFTTNLKMAEEYKNKKELSEEASRKILARIVRLEAQQSEVRNNRDFDRLEKEIQDEKSRLRGAIYPVYLSIQNPFIVDAKGGTWYDARQDISVDIGYKIARGIDAIEALAGKNNAAPNLGYDGIIFKNVLELSTSNPEKFKDYVGDTYMVFKPTQIKSAQGNKGTFDANNTNIYFQSPIDKNTKERHTKAINNLIDNFEKENVKDMEQSVRDYLEERGNPVSESVISDVLSNRGYSNVAIIQNVREAARNNPTQLLKMLDSIGVTLRKC